MSGAVRASKSNLWQALNSGPQCLLKSLVAGENLRQVPADVRDAGLGIELLALSRSCGVPDLSGPFIDCTPITEHEIEAGIHEDRIGRFDLLNAVDTGTDLNRHSAIGPDLHRPQIGQDVRHQLGMSDSPWFR